MAPIRYRAAVYDSARWQGFELRPGDIIVSTPPKCGTTWTQQICALLVLQDPALDAPLGVVSPWIDMVTSPRTEVFAELAAQTHRRFMKTHTPLDGIPQDPRVTYICVGRDPRDVAVSMGHHRQNLDVAEVMRARVAAAAVDGIEPEPMPALAPPSDDPTERFWAWVDDDADPTRSTSNLRFTIHHLRTFREAPPDLDVVWLHYDDLLDDLEGQMRGVAERLGIDVPKARWAALVQAATFDEMRRHAELTAPGATRQQWHDPSRFFHTGSSGQWRTLLDDAGAARYARRVRSLAPPELVDWLHREPLAEPEPERGARS